MECVGGIYEIFEDRMTDMKSISTTAVVGLTVFASGLLARYLRN